MTEPNPLAKAETAVAEAADNTELVRTIAAVLAAQQAMQQTPMGQSPTQTVPVRHPYGLYVAAGIGGAVALTFLAMAAALLAVAVAVGAVCATVCLLVLRGLWADFQKGK